MGILTELARRRNENRIKRKSKQPKKAKPGPDIDKMLQPHIERIQRFRNNIMSERRKQEGKQILKQKIAGASRGAFIAFGKESRSLFVDESKHPRKRR